jgi:GTP-binding protein
MELAFAGRSNVGKSSLLNTLMNRKGLVRTSRAPGCTRQLNFFEAKSADGALLTLVDLPGYGYAKRSKTERRAWGELIEGYLMHRISLRAVVILVDCRRGIEDEERELIELLESSTASRPPLTVVIVATKLDKVPAAKRKLQVAKLKREIGPRVIAFSSKDGTGQEQLWRRLRRAAGVEVVESAEPAAS